VYFKKSNQTKFKLFKINDQVIKSYTKPIIADSTVFLLPLLTFFYNFFCRAEDQTQGVSHAVYLLSWEIQQLIKKKGEKSHACTKRTVHQDV
jgi:hypothetical protein